MNYSLNAIVHRMSNGDKAQFKHSLGTYYKDISPKIMVIFYKYFHELVNSEEFKKDEYLVEKVFLSVCAYCQNPELDKNSRLDEAIHRYKISNNQRDDDSFSKKVDRLLETSWELYPERSNRLFADMIRHMSSSHYYVDADSLMRDLEAWDININVRKSWVETIYP